MKKLTGLLCASAMLFAACFFPFPAQSQTTKAETAIDAPPPDSSSPDDASSKLVPLSTLDNSSEAAPAKTASSRHTTHRKHKSHKKKKHAASGKSGDHTRIRIAQIDLVELGYNPGTADGLMGPITKAALKAFQRDHHMHADGILGSATYEALLREAGSRNPMKSSAAAPENFFATHPDYYGYYGPDYANPTAFGSPQTIPNRFGTLQLSAQRTGQNYQFALLFNGNPVFHADNQPTAINVSRTFNLANADAIVLTAYAGGDSVCPYRHSLLIVRANDSNLQSIANCTKAYQAFTENGILFISFPGDHVSGWKSGDMWRYENGTLTKL